MDTLSLPLCIWEGVCYLALTWEGLCVLELKLNKSHAPLYCTEIDLCALKAIRSHRLDNTPAKSTVPANDKMANYKLRVF